MPPSSFTSVFDARGVAADDDVERRVGHHRDVNRVGQVGDVHAGDDVAIRVHAAAHFEREERIVIRVAIGSIMAIDRDVRHFDAALTEDDRVGRRIRAGWLAAIDSHIDPRAAGNGKFHRSATGCQGLATDINQPVGGNRVIGCCLGLAVTLRCAMNQQFLIGATAAQLWPELDSCTRTVPGGKPTTIPWPRELETFVLPLAGFR